MKTGTSKHPKTERLMRLLNIKRDAAVGILNMLWEYACEYAPRGDVGRYADEEIAAWMEWPCDRSDELIGGLVDAGWLDRSSDDGVRLVVHDWMEHCPEYLRKRMKRQGVTFVSAVRRTMADIGGHDPPKSACPTKPNPTQSNDFARVRENSSVGNFEAGFSDAYQQVLDLWKAGRESVGLCYLEDGKTASGARKLVEMLDAEEATLGAISKAIKNLMADKEWGRKYTLIALADDLSRWVEREINQEDEPKETKPEKF